MIFKKKLFCESSQEWCLETKLSELALKETYSNQYWNESSTGRISALGLNVGIECSEVRTEETEGWYSPGTVLGKQRDLIYNILIKNELYMYVAVEASCSPIIGVKWTGNRTFWLARFSAWFYELSILVIEKWQQ